MLHVQYVLLNVCPPIPASGIHGRKRDSLINETRNSTGFFGLYKYCPFVEW